MKTKVEISGYEISIEEVDGVVSVKAEKEGDVVEEFSLNLEEESEEKSEEAGEEGKEVKSFDEFEEEKDLGEEESKEEEEEEKVEEGLKSFGDFFDKKQ